MRVNHIDHINLRTPLVEETALFYEQVLQLRRGRASGMDQARNAWLYDDEDRAIVHVNMPDEDEDAVHAVGTGRLHHIAFDCQGHDSLIRRLTDLNQEFSTNYIAEIALRQVFVMDPNGVRLELNFRART